MAAKTYNTIGLNNASFLVLSCLLLSIQSAQGNKQFSHLLAVRLCILSLLHFFAEELEENFVSLFTLLHREFVLDLELVKDVSRS